MNIVEEQLKPTNWYMEIDGENIKIFSVDTSAVSNPYVTIHANNPEADANARLILQMFRYMRNKP